MKPNAIQDFVDKTTLLRFGKPPKTISNISIKTNLAVYKLNLDYCRF